MNEVYQLAADMGGAGYIFTGEHDAAVMHNSATINLNVLELGVSPVSGRYFIPPRHVFIQNTTKSIRTIPIVRRFGLPCRS